nr:InlB B-repeat-containing protein [Bifidobacterium adolescentis]
MIAGTSKAASVKLKYANGRYELRGTWTSSNPSVISVDDNGTLHAKAPGTATITVNRQSYSFSKQITVTLSTISFSGNGATSGFMESIQGAIGQSATIPNVGFSRTGYTFTGWNTSPDGTGTAYRPNATIQFAAQNITLYAQWKVRSYSVNFDSNGGSAVASQSVKYGSKASRPTDPTRAGHTFQGWYTSRDGGARYDFNQTVTGDVTLYAHWSVNSYTLAFDGNGGKASESSRTVQYGSQYGSLPTATRTGHTFQGWYTAKSGGTKVSPSTTMGAANTTLYAHWSVNAYTLAFDGNGGKASESSRKVQYGNQYGTLPTATRTGYAFQGWYTARSDGSQVSSSTTMEAANTTVYAHWTVNTYTVSFDSNGGSAVASQSVRYGSKATQPANPTRAGHTFQGWYTARSGGSKYDFGTAVTGDVTLYAHWSVNSYTLTFDGNGGKPSEASRTVAYGGQYGSLPTATRTGYAFQGWYTARDGGTKVSPSTTMGAADTTLYARWSVNSYTVSFDSDGGSNVPAQKVRYGSKASRPADPTRAGHTFQGWYTSRDGGSKYDFGTAVTGDVTLHAHWAKEPAALRRLSGATRYDTMERIVGAGGWRSGGTVIVASGGNYPDALAASGLAGVLDAPIVLTDGNTLSVQASARLTVFRQVGVSCLVMYFFRV